MKKSFWTLAAVLAIYVPFLGLRPIRTAGDEKVYVAQALEMYRGGDWMLQRLQGSANYYKGPLHYLALCLGFQVGGTGGPGATLWPTLWMNLALMVAFVGLSCGLLRRTDPSRQEFVARWTLAWVCSLGVFLYAFSSQMELELAAIFGIAVFFLWRTLEAPVTANGAHEFGFWIAAGAAGLVKSPLHSGLLGGGALLAWSVHGSLGRRLRSAQSWASVIVGVGICLAGYAPAYFYDRKAWLETYLGRETFSKGSSGTGIWPPLVSTWGYYLFPWTLHVWVGLAAAFKERRELWQCKTPPARAVIAGLAVSLPSAVFFMLHDYRLENYNLPTIAGVLLAGLTGYFSYASPRARRWTERLTGALVLGLGLALAVILTRVLGDPAPTWWPRAFLPVWLGASFVLAALFFRQAQSSEQAARRPTSRAWSLGLSAFFICVAALLTVLGEREMIDARTYIATEKPLRLVYANFNRNIWNEWAYLRFMIPYDVEVALDDASVFAEDGALAKGETVIVAGDPHWEDFLKRLAVWKSSHTDTFLNRGGLKVTPWKRWRTRGQASDGRSLWIELWHSRDTRLVERDYQLVRWVRAP